MIDIRTSITLKPESTVPRPTIFRRVDNASKWHTMLVGSEGGKLSHLTLLGNADKQGAQRGVVGGWKHHGLLLSNGPWYLENVSSYDNLHAGIYLYENFRGVLSSCRGSGNGFGDIVLTGKNQSVRIQGCVVDHLNHEIEQVGEPGQWIIDDCTIKSLGILTKNQGDSCLIRNCDIENATCILNNGLASFADCRLGIFNLQFPGITSITKSSWNSMRVLFQTKYLNPGSNQVLRVEDCEGDLKVIGKGILILRNFKGVVSVEPASGGIYGIDILSEKDPIRVERGEVSFGAD